MPSVVVLLVACDPCPIGACTEMRDALHRLLHFILSADNAHQILHCILQIVLNLIWIFAGSAAIERCESGTRCCLKLLLVNRCGAAAFGEFRSEPSGAPSEDHKIRERITAQAIRAMQPGGHF